MVDQTPLKLRRNGGVVDAISEMTAGEAVPLLHGGTGANTASDARTALGVDGPGIKTLYEAEPDTNAFTDTLLTKLSGISDNANNYTHPDHSGDVTSFADGLTTIQPGVVGNTKLADVATATIKGRITAGSGSPEDLTGAQVTDLLRQFATSVTGIVPASGGGSANFLRADGIWAVPPTAGGGETNDGSNVGTAGVGIFKDKSGAVLRFFKVNAGSSVVTVGLDVPTDEVRIDLDQDQMRNASGAQSGFLTAADYNKLAGIADNANNYNHPNHTGDVVSAGDGSVTILGGVVSNSKLATVAAHTLKGRATTGTGAPEDLTIGGLTEEVTPTSGHLLLAEVGGELRYVDVGNLPTGGGGEVNTGINLGVTGVGLFKNKSGLTLQFKSVAVAAGALTLTDDTPNDLAVFDLDEDSIRLATSGQAGFLTAADFDKLAAIEAAAELNTAANVGLTGLGVYARKTNSQLDFKTLYSAHPIITLTDNTDQDQVDFGVDQDAIRLVSTAGAPTPPPLAPGDTPLLGFNTNRVQAGERAIHFVDLMKDSDFPRIGDATGTPTAAPATVYGFGSPYETWPDFTGLSVGETVTCVVGSGKGGSFADGTAVSPYVLTWDGDGELSLRGSNNAATLQSFAGSRKEYLVDTSLLGPGGQLAVYSSVIGTGSTDGTNPLRNWKLWTPGNEGASGAALLDPRMVEKLSQAPTGDDGKRIMRAMNWSRCNHHGYAVTNNLYFLQVAGQRTETTSMSQGWSRGMAIEHVVAYANTTNSHLWWTFPHRGNNGGTLTNDLSVSEWQALMQEEMEYIRDNLNSDLKFYVEYSNETWNPGFPVNVWLNARATAQGTSAEIQCAIETKIMFDLADSVFAVTGREADVLHVVSGRAGIPTWGNNILSRLQTDAARVDMYCVALYPQPTQTDLDNWTAGTPTPTAQDVVAAIQADLDTRMPTNITQLLASAASYTNPDLSNPDAGLYEWGQHCLPSPNGTVNYPWAQAMYDAQRHPDLYTVYRNAIATIYANNIKVSCHQALVYTQGQNFSGFWGIYGAMNDAITLPVQDPYLDETFPKAAAVLQEANDPNVDNSGVPGFMSVADKLAHDELANANALVAKSSPAAADILTIEDSTDSWARKRVRIDELPTGSGEANTASNVGTGGIGVFKQKAAEDLEFKQLRATGTIATLADNVGNNTIDLVINEANIRLATGAQDGFMAAGDFTKLAGVANNANNYAHPNHTGDVTSTGDGATVIANSAVTNAKMANMSAWTLKLRNNASAGAPQDVGIGALTEEVSPTTGHLLLAEVAGQLRYIDVGNLPTGGGGEVNTGSNIGTAGVGLFKQKTGVDFEFKKLNVVGGVLTVTDDVANNEVDVGLQEDNIRLATSGQAGFLTAADFDKLAGIATSANNYTHPDHSGDVTSTGDGATVIVDGVVTNAKLANVATATIKGRALAGTGAPTDLTGAQVTDLLRTFGASATGVVPASGGGGTNFLRADGVWAVPPDTGEANTASNVGATGVGLFKQKTGDDFEFYKLIATGGVATVTLNGVNNNVEVAVDEDAIRLATGGQDGFLSAAGFTKLGGIADNANNYSHPNHTGDVTSLGDGALTIAAAAVTNAKLADMAASTIKARITGSTGSPEDATPAQIRTLLNVEDGASADQTGGEIKALYEAELDTNAFTDALLTKLNGVADNANNYTHPNHTGDVTSVGDGALTIAAGAVTTAKILDENVTWAKVQHINASTILGRITTEEGVVEELMPSQVKTILNYQASDVANNSGVAGANVGAALDTLDTAVGTKYDSSDAVSSSSGGADSGKLVLLGADGTADDGFVGTTIAEIIPFKDVDRNRALAGASTPSDGQGKAGDTYFDASTGHRHVKELGDFTGFFPKSPNFSNVDYTPSDVSVSHSSQRLSVFLPPGTAPTSGFPAVLYSGAGNFLEHTPGASITESNRVLSNLLKRGIAVVWVGCTGINSTGIGTEPGLFWEEGSAGFDSYASNHFFPEKDGIWSIQFIRQNAATYSIDPNRLGIAGTSSGIITLAWGALGPAPTFTGADAMLSQPVNVQAAILTEPPTWWDAFLSTTSSFAPHYPTAADAAATTLANADQAVLKEASLDYRVRQTSAGIEDTPVFLGYDEPLTSTNFGRTGGDPDLSNTIDIATALHASWFGYSFISAIATQSTNRLDDSCFYVQRGKQLRDGVHTSIDTFNTLDPRYIDAGSNWLEDLLSPGLWVDKGVAYFSAGTRLLGRADGAGAGISQEITPAQANAILWDAIPQYNILASNTAAGFPDAIAVAVNSIVGRGPSGGVVAAPVGAGQIVYNNNAGSGVGAADLDTAILEQGALLTGTAAQISALTEKASPVSGDHLLLEDSAAGNAKKRVQVGNLPAGTPADDSITNAKLDNMVQARIKGRTVTGGTGDPQDLTAAQVNAITWSAVGQYSILVSNTAAGFPDALTVGTNSFVGRGSSGNVVAAPIGAGQVPYNNEAGSGLQPTNLETALEDQGYFKSMFVICFEENGNLNTGTASGYQWSLGNGATGSGLGITLPYACNLVAITANFGNSTCNGTVAVRKNATTTVDSITGSGTSTANSKTGLSHAFAANDVVNCQTTANGTGTVTGPHTMALWFERTA